MPDLDLAIANYNSETNYWFRNDSTGGFGRAIALPTVIAEDSSAGLSLGDADGDNDLDVFVANDSGAPNRALNQLPHACVRRALRS